MLRKSVASTVASFQWSRKEVENVAHTYLVNYFQQFQQPNTIIEFHKGKHVATPKRPKFHILVHNT